MTETTHLGLPYLAAAQAQKHVTHNDALSRLDTVVQLVVIDTAVTAPPGSPAAGDRYIVGSGATGAWAGHDGEIAAFVDGAWLLIAPRPGWIAFDSANDAMLVRGDDGWVAAGDVLGAFSLLGVNIDADDTNRLAVRSGAVLFTGVDAGDGGTGDIRFVVNKEADGDTASLLFQSGFSGRAEVGLAGDTDLAFKVSADGSAWTEAIRIDKDTGLATLAGDPSAAMHAATKQYVDAVVVAASDAMVFRGSIDCSASPDYPAGDRGDTYRVSVAGKIGGVSGITVEAGDLLLCLTDATASGNHATVGANWSVAQANIDGAVIGPASVTDGVPALFDGVTGKLIKATTFGTFKTALALAKADVGLGSVDNIQQLPLSYLDTDGTLAANSDSRVASQKAVKTYLGTLFSVLSVQVFNASGTYTPTAGMKFCIVEGVGGGGGGGGGDSNGSTQNSSGAGGAGGTYSRKRFTAADIGASKAVAIGAAGAAGSAGNNAGGTGGTTTLGSTLLTAPGGGGGASAANVATALIVAGGSPGAAGTGDVSVPGEPGKPGVQLSISSRAPGMGGDSALGHGGASSIGNSASGAAAGNAGGNYGGGGSGGRGGTSGGTAAGGAGAAGILIVWEFG